MSALARAASVGLSGASRRARLPTLRLWLFCGGVGRAALPYVLVAVVGGGRWPDGRRRRTARTPAAPARRAAAAARWPRGRHIFVMGSQLMIPAVTLPEFYLINKATDGSVEESQRPCPLRCLPALAASSRRRPPAELPAPERPLRAGASTVSCQIFSLSLSRGVRFH